MALTEAQFLTTNAGQQAQAMLAPATSMLSSALNNAVESGRRMVDLQSHQEDIFMTEREKLRLAAERKGLEARRVFESDRGFNEDVFKDRRNFAEDMFRDERNFGLKSEIERGQLSLARSGQDLQRDLGWAQIGVAKDDAANKKAYYRTQEKIADIKLQEAERELGGNTYLGSQLDNLLINSPTMDRTLDQQWAQNVLGVGTDNYRSGSMEDLTDLDMYDQDVQQVQDLVKNTPREEVERLFPKLNPRQQAIAQRILFKKGGIASKFNSGKAESNLLVGSLAPTGKGAGGGSFMSTFNTPTGTGTPSVYSPVTPTGYLSNQPAVSINRDERDFTGFGVIPPRSSGIDLEGGAVGGLGFKP